MAYSKPPRVPTHIIILMTWGGGGVQRDFLGSEILGKRDFLGSMKDAGIFLRKNTGSFWGN